MHVRNRLLALICLLAFAGVGYLYFNAWVVQKPFGIILFIGDGLTPQTLAAARIYDSGADKRLRLEDFPNLALLSNYAEDLAIPDTAAAATALATGQKVSSGTLGLDIDGRSVPNLLELAAKAGRATGLVTTGSASDPGAAAFFAHAAHTDDATAVTGQLNAKTLPDIFLSGGEQDFQPVSKGGRRSDGRDILLELQDQGIEIVRTHSALEGLGGFRTAKLMGVFSRGNLAYSDRRERDSRQPSLSDMVRFAIESLQFHGAGYLLVVDAELITRAAQDNDGERVLRETLALDEAIATARRYAGENALIIATGKHGTGGMALNASPLRQEAGVAILGTNVFGVPAITWATGPHGPGAAATPPPDPAAFNAPKALNHATDVIAVGVGDGSEQLHGFMDNTAIFEILRAKL